MKPSKKQLDDSRFVLTQGQVEKILSAETNFRNRIILLLLATAGLRREEVCHLMIGDVDFKGRKLRVVGKRNKERYIPLTSSTISQLKFYIGQRKRGYLFPSGRKGSGPISKWTINVICEKAGKAAQVEHPARNRPGRAINPHLFRHTWARKLLGDGIDLKSVSDLLGHESVQTTADFYGTRPFLEIQENFEEKVKFQF